MHKKCCLLVCLFALSPPEEKKRRQVEELEGVVGGSVVQEIDGERRGKRVADRRGERGGTVWKNCPVTTVQQACIGECHECTLVSPVTLPHFKQIKPILYRLLQKQSNFFSAVFTAVTCFCHTFPNYIYVTCLIASNPLWLMWKLVFLLLFFQAVILPTRQETTYCTLTERHIDGHRYTEQIQRDRNKREGERQRNRSRF